MTRRLAGAAALVAALFSAAAALAQHRDSGDAFGFHTFLSWDETNGVQIEYLDGAGGAYLWYPGVAETIVGTWRVSGGEICFVYPGYGLDDPTLPRFDEEICMTLDYFFTSTLSKREGDVFDLRSGRPPFIMRRSDYFADFEAVTAGGR